MHLNVGLNADLSLLSLRVDGLLASVLTELSVNKLNEIELGLVLDWKRIDFQISKICHHL